MDRIDMFRALLGDLIQDGAEGAAEDRARAARMLGPVSPHTTRHLDDALGRLRHQIAPDHLAAEPVIYRDLAPGETGWITQRFAEYLRQTYGLDASFEALVGQITAGYLANHDPALERVWIAERAGMKLGTIMCVRGDQPGVAKLRLFFVDPVVQGQGIGAELVDRCIAFARGAGYDKLVLWTLSELHAAIRLYEKAGFVCVDRVTETAFGQTVENQTWELPL